MKELDTTAAREEWRRGMGSPRRDQRVGLTKWGSPPNSPAPGRGRGAQTRFILKQAFSPLFPLESFPHPVRSGEKFFQALILHLCRDGPPFGLQWPPTQARSQQLREEERVHQGVGHWLGVRSPRSLLFLKLGPHPQGTTPAFCQWPREISPWPPQHWPPSPHCQYAQFPISLAPCQAERSDHPLRG